MVKKLALIMCAFLLGCASQPSFKDGTITNLGAMLPYDGQLYGVQLISYVNGCVVRVPTNMCYEIQRNHCATNSWMWGMLDSVEHSDTRVRLK